MVPSTRTRTPSADMEAVLLDAADDLLEAEGPDALSIRRIAARAGVAPMGVYNHFDSKSGIVDALYTRSFERLTQALSASDQISDPLDAILEAGEHYRDFALAHPEAYKLMFHQSVAGFVPSDQATTVCLASFDRLHTMCVRAIDAGVLGGDNSIMVAQMIWASLHGWVSLEINGISLVSDHRAGARALGVAMLSGLRPPLS